MTASLYNCSAEGPDSFLVTKFDTDLNPEATYALSAFEDDQGVLGCTCDCPAGHRPTCRHRQMLSLFIGNKHVDDGWFLNWNTRQWHRPVHDLDLPAPPSDTQTPPPQDHEAASVGEAASLTITAEPVLDGPAAGTEKGVASLPSPVQGPEGKAVVSPPAPTKKLIFKRRV